VDIAKLREYSLNLEHSTGKHKARVFVSALGLKAKDAEWLREVIRERAVVADAVAEVSSQFGDHLRYGLRIDEDREDGNGPHILDYSYR
jgi:hypothetical protein